MRPLPSLLSATTAALCLLPLEIGEAIAAESWSVEVHVRGTQQYSDLADTTATHDGGYLSIGYGPYRERFKDGWATKVGPDGAPRRIRSIRRPLDDRLRSVTQTRDGGFE